MKNLMDRIERIENRIEVLRDCLEVYTDRLENERSYAIKGFDYYYDKARKCIALISKYNEILDRLYQEKLNIELAEVESASVVNMNLQLLANASTEVEKKMSKKDIATSIIKAEEKGYSAKNPCQAHIINHFPRLFNDEFYMKENNKTDRIPVFNLPNIKVQVDFLQVIKNNPSIMDLVPAEEKEHFEEFVEYMKKNKMCVNCQTCMGTCYNNKAYTQYPTKALCDLRQLYRLLKKPHVVVGEIVQETINTKNARLNGSGEIHNQFILDVYKKVARINKDTKYYTYTKNFELLEGQKLPSNLIINKSDFGTEELIEKSNEFLPINMNTFKAVTPEEMEEIKKDKKKSKYICHGESCSTCRLCTVKKGITIYCEIH